MLNPRLDYYYNILQSQAIVITNNNDYMNVITIFSTLTVQLCRQGSNLSPSNNVAQQIEYIRANNNETG